MYKAIRDNKDLRQQGTTCRVCGQHFPNRRALHEHRQTAHNLRGSTLQPLPWAAENSPIDHSDNPNDLLVYAEYLLNRADILENHREDSILRTYNFPLAFPPTDNDIEEQMTEIYRRQRRSYKINVSPGFILQTNRRDDSNQTVLPYTDQTLRYYYPSTNNHILETALTITNEADLQAAIRVLQGINIPDRVQRPDTSYDLKFITQLKYYVFELPRALGCSSHASLPRHVLKHYYIFTQHERGAYQADEKNLCLFFALAQHQKWLETKNRVHLKFCTRAGRLLYTRFVSYALARGLLSQAELRVDSFKGVPRHLLPHIENIFDVGINMLSLSADRTAVSTYVTTRKDCHFVFLNECDGHVNLILDIDRYCGYYSCVVCQKLFRRRWVMQRHFTHCTGKAARVFSGGFLRQFRSLFDQLADVGIQCADRVNPYFGVWDLEVRLAPCQEGNANLTYTARHVPVCAAVCSNIPGYTEGKVFIDPDEQSLIDSMFDYFDAMRSAMADIALQKWGWILDDLESFIAERERELESEGMARQLDRDIDGLLMDEMGCNSDGATSDSEGEESGFSPPKASTRKKAHGDAYLALLKRLHKSVTLFIHQLPLVSYFGGTYDKNVCKSQLAYRLLQDQEREEAADAAFESHEYLAVLFENESRPYRAGPANVIKKGNRHICVANAKLKMLDMCHFLGPGMRYDDFVQLFCPGQKKFHPFPYEYFQSFDQLDDTELPKYPGPAWFSQLRQEDLLNGPFARWQECGSDPLKRPQSGQEKFDEIRAVWVREGWQTMRDFLRFYALFDVKPFVAACISYAAIWADFHLDVWRNSVSLPSLANVVLWKDAVGRGDTFPLISKRDKSMYYAQRKNLVAGQSILFCRRQEVGVTRIRHDSALITRCLIGSDCNSLYAYVMGRYAMGINTYVRRTRESGFKPISNFRQHAMYVWLAYCGRRDGLSIVTKQTHGQEILIKNFRVDGLAIFWDDAQQKNVYRVYEFYGCYHHGCVLDSCSVRRRCTNDAWAGRADAYERTMRRERIIKSAGYQISSVWECAYYRLAAANAEVKSHRDRFRPPFYTRYPRPVKEETIIEGIRSGLLFGLVIVDLKVRDEFAYLYSEFPCLFANMTLGYEDLCDEMRAYVDKAKLKFTPKRLLVSANKAEQIMISTDYCRWVLLTDHFMIKVHHVDEYCKGFPFTKFMDFVTSKRRAAAMNPALKKFANTWKLAANACFGQQLINRELHEETRYVSGSEKARYCINENRFRSLTPLDKDIFEVNMAPRRIKMTSPIGIGLFILNGAKTCVLRFLYNFIYAYIDRTLVGLSYSDTDSIYWQLPYTDIATAVKADKKAEFNDYLYNRCHQDPDPDNLKFHFMRACCPRCTAYDALVGNLWKQEFEGHLFLGISSKSYFAKNTETGQQKFSCKGVSKREIARQGAEQAYTSVLTGKTAHYSVIRGFKVVHASVMSYSQKKRAFDYLYCKRGVFDPPNENYTYTLPRLVLKPCTSDDEFVVLQKAAPELTADYAWDFVLDGNTYCSIRQALVFMLAYKMNAADVMLAAAQTCDDFVLKRLFKELSCLPAVYCVNKGKILARIVEAVHEQNEGVQRALTKIKDLPLVNAEENIFLGVGEEPSVVKWLNYKDLAGQNKLALEWEIYRARGQADVMDTT